MLASLDELLEQMPSLLDIDHPCAKKQITEARKVVEVSSAQTFRYIYACFFFTVLFCV